MTAATFGDVLGAARRHLDAATGVTGSIADPESITAAAITGRLAMTLSRFLADVAPYDMAEVITSSTLGAQMRAAVQAREALQLAADGLRTGTRDQDRPGPEPADPLTAHLATAAAALAAGRDLLRTHATTGTDGHWKPRSRWAAVIGSELVGQALAAEVALCSKPLTLLTAWLSVAAQADAATPAPIRQGLAAASPLLLTATTTLTAAQHEHPATALDAELLRSIPVNHLPPPRPPRDNETVTDLAAGIAISAARIHALHPATAGQAAWAPELTAESWRWTATGAAIICDISHLMLTSLTHRASQFDDTPPSPRSCTPQPTPPQPPAHGGARSGQHGRTSPPKPAASPPPSSPTPATSSSGSAGSRSTNRAGHPCAPAAPRPATQPSSRPTQPRPPPSPARSTTLPTRSRPWPTPTCAPYGRPAAPTGCTWRPASFPTTTTFPTGTGRRTHPRSLPCWMPTRPLRPPAAAPSLTWTRSRSP
jgi:hypothetical protein